MGLNRSGKTVLSIVSVSLLLDAIAGDDWRAGMGYGTNSQRCRGGKCTEMFCESAPPPRGGSSSMSNVGLIASADGASRAHIRSVTGLSGSIESRTRA